MAQRFNVGDLLAFTEESFGKSQKLNQTFYLYAKSGARATPVKPGLLLIYLGPRKDDRGVKCWEFYLPEIKEKVNLFNRTLFKTLVYVEGTSQGENVGPVEDNQLGGLGVLVELKDIIWGLLVCVGGPWIISWIVGSSLGPLEFFLFGLVFFVAFAPDLFDRRG